MKHCEALVWWWSGKKYICKYMFVKVLLWLWCGCWPHAAPASGPPSGPSLRTWWSCRNVRQRSKWHDVHSCCKRWWWETLTSSALAFTYMYCIWWYQSLRLVAISSASWIFCRFLDCWTTKTGKLKTVLYFTNMTTTAHHE